MLGNGFFIGLYLTGISRLFRAPETTTHNEKCKFKKKGKLYKLMKTELTRRKTERKLCLKITGIAVKVFIRDHYYHPLTPAHSESCW